MKTALLVEPGRVEVKEVEDPKAGQSEVVVSIKACGVCATDVKKFTGASQAPHMPFVLGHEPAGVVVEAGEGAGPELASGTRVAVAPVYTCGTCYGCRTGLTYSEGMGMCENYKVLGYSIDGAFVEKLVVPTRHVHPIPDDLSFRDAALIEPVAACVNGALRANRQPPGTVIGNRVIASDLMEERRNLALALGAEFAIDPETDDVVKKVRDLTHGRGGEAVVCSVGGKEVTEQGLAMLAKGGVIVLLASGPGGTKFEVDLNKLHYDQSVITGAVSYTNPGYQWSMELLSRGLLDTDTLITAEGPLEDAGRFLAMTRDLQGLKKVVLV
jgi:L-iditol 2-dehydrogenase